MRFAARSVDVFRRLAGGPWIVLGGEADALTDRWVIVEPELDERACIGIVERHFAENLKGVGRLFRRSAPAPSASRDAPGTGRSECPAGPRRRRSTHVPKHSAPSRGRIRTGSGPYSSFEWYCPRPPRAWMHRCR